MVQVLREAKPLPNIEPPSFLNYGNAMDDTLSTGMAAAKRCNLSVLDKANAIIARRQMVDPRMTEGGNLYEIERMADQFIDYVTHQFANAQAALNVSIAAAENKLTTTVGIKPTASAQALQERLHTMSPAKRAEAVSAAFANNDRELIGALVGQHPLLHGCDAVMIAGLFDKYQRDTAPSEYASLAAHRQAKEWLDKSALMAMRFAASAYSGTQSAAAKRKEIASILASYGMDLSEPAPNGAGFDSEPA